MEESSKELEIHKAELLQLFKDLESHLLDTRKTFVELHNENKAELEIIDTTGVTVMLESIKCGGPDNIDHKKVIEQLQDEGLTYEKVRDAFLGAVTEVRWLHTIKTLSSTANSLKTVANLASTHASGDENYEILKLVDDKMIKPHAPEGYESLFVHNLEELGKLFNCGYEVLEGANK